MSEKLTPPPESEPKQDPYRPDYLPEDEHLDSFPEDTGEPADPRIMGEWDIAHQAKIEQSSESLTSKEEDTELSGKIQAGLKAAKTLATKPRRGENKIALLKTVKEGQAARDTLVTAHLRLAAWYVRQVMDFQKERRISNGEEPKRGKYTEHVTDLANPEMDYADYMQLASIGVITAAEKWDPQRGSFSTFAYYHIESELLRARNLQYGQSPIRVPINAHDELNKFRVTLQEQPQTEPEDKRLEAASRKLGWPLEKTIFFNDVMYGSQPISLEIVADMVEADLNDERASASADEDNPTSISDLIADSGIDKSVLDEVAFEELGYRLDTLMEELNERDQAVLDLYFGLDNGEPMTYEEVGEQFNLTRERIRQITSRALAILRHHRRAQGVEGFYRTGDDDPTGGAPAELGLSDSQETKLGINRAKSHSFAGYNMFFGSNRRDRQYKPKPVYTLKTLAKLRELQAEGEKARKADEGKKEFERRMNKDKNSKPNE